MREEGGALGRSRGAWATLVASGGTGSKAEEVTGSRSRPGPGEGGSAWAQEEEARWRCDGGELAGTPSGRGRRGALLLSACRGAGGGRWGEGIGRGVALFFLSLRVAAPGGERRERAGDRDFLGLE